MAQDAGAKPKLSGKLMQLKFMQRAVEKDRPMEPAPVQAEPVVSEHWVAPGEGAAQRCTVIMEDDPKPGALLGRMSFRNYNVETEKMQAEAEARAAEASGATPGASVSDAQMAQRLGGARSGKHAAAGGDEQQPSAKKAKKAAAGAAPAAGGFQKPPEYAGRAPADKR